MVSGHVYIYIHIYIDMYINLGFMGLILKFISTIGGLISIKP